jgi:DNA polymerase I
MGNWDVRLINGNYKIENDAPVIFLYGRTKEGQAIVIRYEGFKPYFFVYGDLNEIRTELEGDSRVQSVEDDELEVEGRKEKCARVTVKIPGDVPNFRERLSRCGFRIFASDIVFVNRFVYDKNLESCIRVEGEEIQNDGKTTTGLFVKADGFEKCEPFNPVLKTLSFDIENSVKDSRLFVIGCVVKEGTELRKVAIMSDDERKMIEEFVELVWKEDPDVITGYNIDNYDIPILLKRGEVNGIRDLLISRDLSRIRSKNDRFWTCHGRIVADAWWNAKLEIRPKQETLDHVAKLLFGEGKGDINPAKMDEEWESDRQKVIDYCLKDAELALRILERIGSVKKAMDLATVSKLPVDDVLNGRTSTLIDSILIREADRNGIAVPQTHRGRRGDTDKRIEGGYVHSIQPGLYNWVCVLDFKSMYPSVIISNNICFTTLSPTGEIESPMKGVRFLSKSQRQGILPKVLETLMKDRDDIKRKMASAGTADERKYYDGLQFAIKILMNAVYGVFASSFYRFTDQKIGSSITAFARKNIKDIITELEGDDVVVIYGDTDSVFFQSPEQNLEGALNFGKEVVRRFSKGTMQIELEEILESFFSHGRKKRYVGKVAWPEGVEEILVRGYETRRTDAFDLQSESQMAIFKKILAGETEEAVNLARQLVRNTLEGNVPIEKLVISRTSKERSFYVNPDRMANVQAAEKLQKMGYEFVPGMKVSWIVVDGSGSPQQVEPYISGRKFEHRPDYRYYAHRLATTLSYVTDVFNWDSKSLIQGSQQKSLFDETFEESGRARSRKKGDREKGKKKVKRTDKELKLEDFM